MPRTSQAGRRRLGVGMDMGMSMSMGVMRRAPSGTSLGLVSACEAHCACHFVPYMWSLARVRHPRVAGESGDLLRVLRGRTIDSAVSLHSVHFVLG